MALKIALGVSAHDVEMLAVQMGWQTENKGALCFAEVRGGSRQAIKGVVNPEQLRGLEIDTIYITAAAMETWGTLGIENNVSHQLTNKAYRPHSNCYTMDGALQKKATEGTSKHSVAQ